MTAGIYSRACGSQSGGDIYYLTVCSSDSLTRFILADLRGHGEQVSELSRWIYEALREHMASLDGSSILSSINERLLARGFHAITTAVVVAFYIPNSRLYFSYAGHPPALFRKRTGQGWETLLSSSSAKFANLPLGVLAAASYSQDSIATLPGDRIAIYTDGIVEASSADGIEFGQDQLCSFLERVGEEDVSSAKQKLVNSLYEFTGAEAQQDDQTLLLIEINKRALQTACA